VKIQIVRSTAFNLAAQLGPIAVALVCMPALVSRLGTERVGLLTIVWVVVGYFSILDFGMGFSVTRSVSEALADGHRDRVSALFWGAVGVQVVLSVGGAAAFLAFVPYLADRLLNIPPELRGETRMAFNACAVAFPMLLTSSSIVGLLQAGQRFDLSAKVQLPMGMAQYLLPLAFSFLSPNLGWIVAVLLANRIVGLLLMLLLAARLFPEIKRVPRIDPQVLKRQLSYGGWLTVCSILSPAMVYVDRFIIGSVLTVAAVAYYAVPLDAVMKLSAIPNSLSTVLFSVFSFYSAGAQESAVRTMKDGVRALVLIFMLPMIVLVVFAGDLLLLWLGPEFARQSTLVLQILLIGIWGNSLTRVPYAYVASTGRADLIAFVQLLQAPIQLAGAFLLIKYFGLTGAAAAWSFRLLTELIIYTKIAERLSGTSLFRPLLMQNWRSASATAAAITVGLLVRPGLPGWAAKAMFSALLMSAGCAFLWFQGLAVGERERLRSRLTWGRA
jgi:O-antigen/teichoic acid export membrane protein